MLKITTKQKLMLNVQWTFTCHRSAKYIGSYCALMEGRLDAIIFTGGIGENAAMVRELSLKKLRSIRF